MQITLVSSGDTVSDVLNRFEANFSLNWAEIEEKFSRWMVSISESLIKKYSIRELKAMTDFLASAFNTNPDDAPKRNSKLSLADWIARVLFDAHEMAEASEAIADLALTTVQCDSVTVSYWFDEKTKKYHVQDDICQVVTNKKYYDAWPDKMATGQYAVASLKLSGQFKLCAPGVGDGNTDFFFCCNPKGWQWEVRHYKYSFDTNQEMAEASEAISAQSGERSPDKNYWCPQCDVWMDRSNFDEILGSDFQEQLCKVCGSEVCHEFDQNSPATVDTSSSEIEVLEPEEKPVYIITIIADGAFSEERVNRLPPYLIDRKGNLLKKFWHRSCDAGYSEITSKHLSSIAANSGLVIELMSDSLQVSQSCIIGDPPPFIVDRGGAYKRDQVRRGLAVSYSQVVSEYLSHIVVVL